MSSKTHEVILPTNTLKMKAAAPGGISEKQAVAAGNMVIQQIGESYAAHASEDLGALDKMLDDVLNSYQTFGIHNEFYRKLHDLRGQAGTFGYELITEIADSLCRYLDLIGEGMAAPTVMIMHLEAIRVVLTRQIKGPGGPAEREIVHGLNTVVRKVTAAGNGA